MGYRIFLAGGSGAIGRRLIPQLLGAGHQVTATTRQAAKTEELRALGADPVLVDVFDADGLRAVLASAKPEIVIHQLTDLPAGLDPARMGEAIARNARIRDEGTRNLVEAARPPALGASLRKALPGPTRPDPSRMPRPIRSTAAPKVGAASASAA